MALSLHDQTRLTIEKSNNILITFKKQHNPDTVATALAFKLFLEKLGKQADITSEAFAVSNQTPSFLSLSASIPAWTDLLSSTSALI